jgi:pimeloyl-ACP methyl ester carboxylesterase
MASGEQIPVPERAGQAHDPLRRSGLVASRFRVRANGLAMSYLEWSGPELARTAPTVLLHSALQQGEGMANLASHLAHRGRVIVPDLRGRGETDQPADGYDPATMADDVRALFDALGLDNAVVIGRLHGGQVAYHLASRHPERVRGLVIGGTVPEITAERGTRMVEGVRALPRRFASFDDALVFYREQLGLPEERARHDIPLDLELRGADYVWRHNLDIVERIERQSTPRDDWDLLSAINCPVLVLRGQLGSITDRVADRFRECLPHCAMQTVLGAGHDVFLGTGAEQSFGAIDMFLVRLSDRAGRGD